METQTNAAEEEFNVDNVQETLACAHVADKTTTLCIVNKKDYVWLDTTKSQAPQPGKYKKSFLFHNTPVFSRI